MEIMAMKFYAILIIIMIGFAARTNAQQTIFNVPSTDILGEGKVYVELDSTFRFNDTRSVNKFSSFGVLGV